MLLSPRLQGPIRTATGGSASSTPRRTQKCPGLLVTELFFGHGCEFGESAKLVEYEAELGSLVMIKWIVAGIVVLIASGCQDAPTFAKHRNDAQQRWSNARASVALRVAENRLASGALDDAHKAAEQALQIRPDSQEARIVLARVLIEKGMFTEAADILDASGCDVILLETVGVGQSELDIAQAADTTVVVLVPESGDGIQAMKAGLMEIADLFVLNKADRPGADQAVMSVKFILGFRSHDEKSWLVDILKTQAIEGVGITETAERIVAHRAYLERSGALSERRRRRLVNRVREIVEDRLRGRFWSPEREAALESAMTQILSRSATPYLLAEQLIAEAQHR